MERILKTFSIIFRIGLPLLFLIVAPGLSAPTLQAQDPAATDLPRRPEQLQPEPRPIPTDFWTVTLDPATDADALARSLGFENLGRIGSLPNTYLFQRPQTDISRLEALTAANRLFFNPDVREFEQQVLRQYETRQVPSEPLLYAQWHLNNTGMVWLNTVAGEDANVFPAWQAGYDGSGVQIAVVDDGVEYNHPDLSPRYRPGDSYDYYDSDSNPMPLADESHGTSVAGVAAAADEGTCGLGAAYNASLAGLRLVAGTGMLTDAQIAGAISHNIQNNDIFNNSWGPVGLGGPGSASHTALETGVTSGRGGLGVIYLWAGGNGGSNNNVNDDAYSNSPYTIAVGATDGKGLLASYGEEGAPILVNAPTSSSGIGVITTDRLNSNGYNNSQGWTNNCTDSFGGTSSATPLVSGIVALMLDANGNLGWRDVQYVLLETADKNHPNDSSWALNGAGYDVSHKYGFGRVDAGEAVTMADTWDNVPTMEWLTMSQRNVNRAIPDGVSAGNPGSYVEDSVTVNQDFVIETVEVIFNASHNYRGDIVVQLVSPSGKVSQLMTLRTGDNGVNYINWPFRSVHHWGENARGTWTIRVADAYNDFTGTFNSWQLRFTGMTPVGNDRIENATPITSTPFLLGNVHTVLSTRASNDPVPSCGGEMGRTQWFSKSMVAGEALGLDLLSSRFNGVISAWTGTPGNLTERACAAGDNGSATLQYTATSTGTVYFMISGRNRDYGLMSLTVDDVATDISLGIDQSVDTIYQTRNQTYTLTARNLGPSGAGGVILEFTLPSQTAYMDSSSSACDVTGQIVTCSLGAIAVNESTEVSIVAEVSADASGTLTANGNLTMSSPELNGANNSAQINATALAANVVSIGEAAYAAEILTILDQQSATLNIAEIQLEFILGAINLTVRLDDGRIGIAQMLPAVSTNVGVFILRNVSNTDGSPASSDFITIIQDELPAVLSQALDEYLDDHNSGLNELLGIEVDPNVVEVIYAP